MAPGPGVAGTPLGGASATDAAVAVPAGVTSGQVVLVDLYLEAARTVTPPAGFTLIGVVDTGRQWHHKYWKRATGADSGTYTFTWTGATYRRAVAARYPGVIASGTPYDGGAGAPVSAAKLTSSTTTPAVSLTTQGPERLLVHSYSSFAAGTWTPAGGYTERWDSDELGAAELAQSSAGLTASLVATQTSNDTTTAWLLALIPAATGPTATAAAPLGALTSSAVAVVADRKLATATAQLGALVSHADGVIVVPPEPPPDPMPPQARGWRPRTGGPTPPPIVSYREVS